MKIVPKTFATTAIGLMSSAMALTCAAVGWSASAMEPHGAFGEHRLSEHPAVTIKRLSEHQGYDYASKFYAHPAGLRLLPAAPDEIEAAGRPESDAYPSSDQASRLHQ